MKRKRPTEHDLERLALAIGAAIIAAPVITAILLMLFP